MKRLSVSAVIPAYNRERFIGEAIESVLRQDRPVDEIIVIDDGSSDGTHRIATSFQGVRVLRLPSNSGTSAARNLGWRSAGGDAIAWLDSDDIWRAHHCAVVVGLLERHPGAAVAFGGVEFFDGRHDRWPVHDLPEAEPFDALALSFQRTVAPMMATVIRRDALAAVGGFDESFTCSVDFDVLLRLARRGPFACSHTITAGYRWHGDQLSARPLRQLEAMYSARLQMLCSLSEAGGDDLIAELRRLLERCLTADLWIAWTGRDYPRLGTLIAIAERAGGELAEVAAPFKRRQYVPRVLVGAWDRLSARVTPRQKRH
jgi:glycosyltransferase involved in cell wall biosynthesis